MANRRVQKPCIFNFLFHLALLLYVKIENTPTTRSDNANACENFHEEILSHCREVEVFVAVTFDALCTNHVGCKSNIAIGLVWSCGTCPIILVLYTEVLV